jgi:mannose-6-phosphate isomerase-like protein (cupin superfamily)
MTARPRRGFSVRAIDELATIGGGTTKLAGAELGIESFGMQVFDFPPDFRDYPEHDHADQAQEEVYLVLRGSAEFEIDGERVALRSGWLVRVAPASRRKLWPGPEGVRILAIGSNIGKQYERPEGLGLPES